MYREVSWKLAPLQSTMWVKLVLDLSPPLTLSPTLNPLSALVLVLVVMVLSRHLFLLGSLKGCVHYQHPLKVQSNRNNLITVKTISLIPAFKSVLLYLLNVMSLANKSFISQDFIMTNNIDFFIIPGSSLETSKITPECYSPPLTGSLALSMSPSFLVPLTSVSSSWTSSRKRWLPFTSNSWHLSPPYHMHL